jgi:hypothetical protein
VRLPLVISTTAYQSGAGTDRYKYVCGLTPEERAGVAAHKAIVMFRSAYRAHGKFGTYWRVCKAGPSGRAYPRVPSDELLRATKRLLEQRETAP